MDERTEIDLYLPSNSKCDFFENKTSHFYVDLERPLILKNGSTCAVEEVIYSNRFYNIIPPYNKIIVKQWTDPEEKKPETFTCRVKNGFYSEPALLVRHINNELENKSVRSSLLYDPIREKVKLKLYDTEEIILHPSLAAILGFVEKHHFRNENLFRDGIHGSYYVCNKLDYFEGSEECPDRVGSSENEPIVLLAENAVNLYHFSSVFYIYSNIVENTIVGNSEVPILAVMNTNSMERRNTVANIIDNPRYIKLNTNFVKLIEIKICDSVGELISFNSGTVIIKLKIKQPRSTQK